MLSIFYLCKLSCINLISITSCNCLIPTTESIIICFIRWFCWSTWFFYSITIMVSCCWKNCSIIILEYNCVINISWSVCCCICCITCTVNYFFIPSLEYISICVISLSSRIIWCSYSITIMICITWNCSSIVINECYCVININWCICCCISCITSYCYNFIVPTSKCITISIIAWLNWCFWCCYSVSIMICCIA